MFVIGGFVGLLFGDVLGYKLLVVIVVKNIVGGYCEGYSIQISCWEDLECGWCSLLKKCLSCDLLVNCLVSLIQGLCFGLCVIYLQCSSCLLFGGIYCGWCVQDSRCYFVNLLIGVCQSGVVSSKVGGWWGNEGQFLMLLSQCKIMDFLFGLIVVEYREVLNIIFFDGIRIVLELEINILQYMIEMIGFVYLFKFKIVFWIFYVLYFVFSNVKDMEVKFWLSMDEIEVKRVSIFQWWI